MVRDAHASLMPLLGCIFRMVRGQLVDQLYVAVVDDIVRHRMVLLKRLQPIQLILCFIGSDAVGELK